MKKTHEAITGKGSAFRQYQDTIIGNRSFLYFCFFEFCLLLSMVPGAAGMVLRKLFWPRLFRRCGKKALFGTGIVLRHPGRVEIGDRVVVSDGCIIDARNSHKETSIKLADDVMLSNDVMLSCKDGSIEIGKNTGINAKSIIQSTNDCDVKLGCDVIVGQRAFIVGGGNYNTDNIDEPIRLQGIQHDGGVEIEDNVWLGGNVSVLGGVRIGHGTILAASTVMTRSVEPYSMCRGIPGKVYGNRKDN